MADAGLDSVPTKIICVGKNYPDHAREMGTEPPSEPIIFMKPPSSLVPHGAAICLPPGAGRVDFEGEVAFQVGRRASHVPVGEALSYLSAVLPLNDVTCRDLQRRDGQWTRAKGFDTFCPVGSPVPLQRVDMESLRIETRINGELRQSAPLSDSLFSPEFLVSYLSRIMTLEPGDLIATGTPDGVGSLAPGDQVSVSIPGVGALTNPVQAGAGIRWPYEEGNTSG